MSSQNVIDFLDPYYDNELYVSSQSTSKTNVYNVDLNSISLPSIISISGRKSSGKTVCAYELQKLGYRILNVADALKCLIRKILFISKDNLEENKNNPNVVFTLNNYQICLLSSELNIDNEIIKDVLSPYEHFTIRQLLQIIGTDLIRKFNKNWHLESLEKKINNLRSQNPLCKICIPDVRFVNELLFIKNKLNGLSYYIIRPLLSSSSSSSSNHISNHISETQLNWTFFGSNILVNNGNLESLFYKLIRKITISNETLDNEDSLLFLKSNLFLNINCKTVYLAGKLFLNNKIKNSLTPFINENYKLWYTSNKRYPDILDTVTNTKLKNMYIRLWLKGIFDFLTNN